MRLKLIDPNAPEIRQVLHWYQSMGPSSRRYLVEFPGVLLASFKDTLAALQEMYKKPAMPFRDILAPSEVQSANMGIKPPRYAMKAGFEFDLSCLARGGNELAVRPQHPPDPEEIASRTTLDPTQSVALVNTLSRELSLIQGPPGTGKSYTGEKIIKVLLANKRKAKLGPIICVCYTNHALDQLLEHLLDDGIGQIIRMGSQSKSERLQDLNLRHIARLQTRTKPEKSDLYHAEQRIGMHANATNRALKGLQATTLRGSVEIFLEVTFPSRHQELFGESEEGWTTVGPSDQINRWLDGGHGGRCRQLHELNAVRLSDMTHDERQLLYSNWIEASSEDFITRVTNEHQQYTSAVESRDRLRKDLDLRCLQAANIIGATTTGLARNLELFQKLRTKVLLCEEAGEVLEAHLLTVLLPSVEHAILIGDHLQLRPQIQNYDLQSNNPRGKQYSLDMSLFERLVQPPRGIGDAVPFSILETQRRMHPSIAELIRSTLYPCLKDAVQVSQYPEVVGMRKRLFWFHHEKPEAGAANNDTLSSSRSNEFEVEMTAALVSHIVRQGEYSKEDIAIITPYLGQLQKLRRRMSEMWEVAVNDRDLEEIEALTPDAQEPVEMATRSKVSKTRLVNSIRVATVDNFQGEEAKVVIISLVRSNPQNNCGFLRTSNRINVLLSRARHGMYIIGNSKTYSSVSMWSDVISMLRAGGNFGTSFELQCPRHPNTPLRVSEPDHFVQCSPESGCILPCDKRLDCGHSCTGRCHSEMLHNVVKCLVDCPRSKKGCDHPCPLRCGDQCHGKCRVRLNEIDLVLPCGHRVSSAYCWEAQDPASIRCTERVSRTVPGCSHSVTVPCYENVNAFNYRCTAKCGNFRPCGHSCPSQCFRCNARENGEITEQSHGVCTVLCGRKYQTCCHSCSRPCHDGSQCGSCNEPCEVRCSHSRCSKKCHEPCAPCAEPKCQSSCPHTSCSLPCAAPCNWVPCSKRCEEVLSCGHQCPSLCGESCPSVAYCQRCGSDGIKSTCVDFLEMKEYIEIDLDDDPCIFADCGHFLTVSSMDSQMDMAANYDLDENGHPVRIRGASEPFSGVPGATKACPTCRGSLRNISRFGRIVRRSMLDEATKKFISWSHAECLRLADSLATEQEKLTKAGLIVTPSTESSKSMTKYRPRLGQLRQLQSTVGERYNDIITLWTMISSFANKVRAEEQPFQRVADLVKHINRQNKTSEEFRFDEAIIQVKGQLTANLLLLKCEMYIFSDCVRLQEGGRANMKMGEMKINWLIYRTECANLINLAHNRKFPREELQSHIFAAQVELLAGLFGSQSGSIKTDQNQNPPPRSLIDDTTKTNEKPLEDLKTSAINHIARARALLDEYPSTAILKDELDAMELMANNGVFYREVSAEEIRAVYKAMSSELMGTGHWYTCENGHPFTVGECGMPMQFARCPECNAQVGGQDHQAVEGVRHAAEIEALGSGVGGMRL
ncbi:hypothetical protein B0H67DRAFT_587383 [Lasiosphaeris hirsuta]|uniref:RZ-type domain-containing protein n=1 Tax=Lasiosphaeris hirsuta TaxID=260670 RepID=A0AA40A146_9PEZI|nr:hypothetical protein B0H67DRAFT_587383 [Lasiosphaeris hirsuta]